MESDSERPSVAFREGMGDDEQPNTETRVDFLETAFSGLVRVMAKNEQHQNLACCLNKKREASMKKFHEQIIDTQNKVQRSRDLDWKIATFSAAGPVAIVCSKYSKDCDTIFKEFKAKHETESYNVVKGAGVLKKESDLLTRIMFRTFCGVLGHTKETIKTRYATYPNIFEWAMEANGHVIANAGLTPDGTGVRISIRDIDMWPGQANQVMEIMQQAFADATLMMEPVLVLVDSELEMRGRKPKK